MDARKLAGIRFMTSPAVFKKALAEALLEKHAASLANSRGTLRRLCQKPASLWDKEAAKFRPAMLALKQRNPQAYNKHLISQGVKPGNQSDLSSFSEIQALRQRRGFIPQSRPSKPAPWTRGEIVNNPRNVRSTLIKRLAETSPPHLPETGKSLQLSELASSVGNTDYRAFNGPVRIDASKPGTRVTSVLADGKTPTKNVYISPTPPITGDYGPYVDYGGGNYVNPREMYGQPPHSGLLGQFKTENLNPAVTVPVRAPGGKIKRIPAYTDMQGNVSKSLDAGFSQKRFMEIARRLPGTEAGLGEAVVSDFRNVQPDRLFKMVDKPKPGYGAKVWPQSGSNSEVPASLSPDMPLLDYTLKELDINNPIYRQDYKKYLAALSKKYGINTSSLAESVRHRAAQQPATY